METVVITSEVELKRMIREVVREEITQLVRGLQQPWQAYEEPLLTRKEMAKHLNISLVTLTAWVRQGLPCIRKGGRVLFLKSEVVKAIKQRTPNNQQKKK
jgi:excisionase family DNA binding protein